MVTYERKSAAFNYYIYKYFFDFFPLAFHLLFFIPSRLVKLTPFYSSLASNIAHSMIGVPDRIIEKQLQHFAKADPKYAELVKKALIDAKAH